MLVVDEISPYNQMSSVSRIQLLKEKMSPIMGMIRSVSNESTNPLIGKSGHTLRSFGSNQSSIPFCQAFL